jgi:predicted RNA binding protein YcfA (HicA-like mRNA interferase family)
MGQDKYPPLTPDEIIAILRARGFTLHHSRGDHNYYYREVRGTKRVMQVDTGNPLYTASWLKLIIKETGMTREEFYCSTKSTAKKINLKCASDEELKNWALTKKNPA